MTDFKDLPAIDDPGGPGGQAPRERHTPPGDTADNVGTSEPDVAELDLPGPDDPVAWSYVTAGTDVVGPDRKRLGQVAAMLGTEEEGIFHGVAVDTGQGEPRVVPADEVTELTPARVHIRWSAERLAQAEPWNRRAGEVRLPGIERSPGTRPPGTRR
jgi:hypothetical protein